MKVPGVMDTLAAPEADHVSTELEPAAMLPGFAVKEEIVGAEGGGGGGALTVTVTVAVVEADPTLFVAVRMYVVVFAGLTVLEPLDFFEEKFPGVIVTWLAPEADHVSTELEPDAMLPGFAAKEEMTGRAPALVVSKDICVFDTWLWRTK